MTTDQAIEVKKDGLRQMQDGTWKLSLTVHPNDMPTSLMTAQMGTRYGMALVEIGDDEKPIRSTSPCKPLAQQEKSSKHRKPADTRAEKARRLCGVSAFWDFIEPKVRHQGSVRFEGADRYEVTSNYVKWHCCVSSKGELDISPEKAKLWDALLAEYEQSTGRMAEKH